MILLDTDHFTILRYAEHPQCAGLVGRLRVFPEAEVATTVITLEEQMRGWLAEIRRARAFAKQVPYYLRLKRLVEVFSRWTVLEFDGRAAQECVRLQKHRIRVGAQDLKIAAIAIVNDALLLSRNLRDFQKIPDLRTENWLD
jgi:tRNA(fMet)-specific endonuclease VapC